MVRARGLTRRYGKEYAVRDLYLEVRPGRIVGLIGPSGSGKTTTVRLMTGLAAPTEGEVSVFGVTPTHFTAEQRTRIGYMPQLSVLYPHLSLRQNLSLAASLYGLPLRGRRRRLRRTLEFVELYEHRRKLLRQTSGGMQRRLALAAALVHEPELLFLDEPTAGLDPVLRRKVWDAFAVRRDEGRTLLVTTQYVGEAAYCDQIAVLKQGRVLTVDTPLGLRRRAFGGDLVDVVTTTRVDPQLLADLESLPWVERVEVTRPDGRGLRVLVGDAATAIPQLQRWADTHPLEVESVSQHLPPFDDVFVQVVSKESRDG